ncbi:hypothetical protein P5673_032417 [Acropora cervicornis]|uniref:Uncharacterized protein n=2 Tax=Acropora TaxID=6127 RepID=A0AAD9PRK7_ACRCE|nr:hypothetical protein P5673_032417 [Acropora cervicornis]
MGPVVVGAVVLAIVVGFVSWWVHKRMKCRRDLARPIKDDICMIPAVSEAGPPVAIGTDGAAERAGRSTVQK